ncbi:hypothetical protein B0T17DRAFT_80596 [Bombardia bombarda]|uniref:Uncharacterized protein n=1 Tax=Bombardia bombarda TaxID=252184 RepID=A0AA40CG88_9PEZI|nr:hypothetical protein B0T17DRAFT_80596 [Bombardia bombarda]
MHGVMSTSCRGWVFEIHLFLFLCYAIWSTDTPFDPHTAPISDVWPCTARTLTGWPVTPSRDFRFLLLFPSRFRKCGVHDRIRGAFFVHNVFPMSMLTGIYVCSFSLRDSSFNFIRVPIPRRKWETSSVGRGLNILNSHSWAFWGLRMSVPHQPDRARIVSALPYP